MEKTAYNAFVKQRNKSRSKLITLENRLVEISDERTKLLTQATEEADDNADMEAFTIALEKLDRESSRITSQIQLLHQRTRPSKQLTEAANSALLEANDVMSELVTEADIIQKRILAKQKAYLKLVRQLGECVRKERALQSRISDIKSVMPKSVQQTNVPGIALNIITTPNDYRGMIFWNDREIARTFRQA